MPLLARLPLMTGLGCVGALNAEQSVTRAGAYSSMHYTIPHYLGGARQLIIVRWLIDCKLRYWADDLSEIYFLCF